MIPMEDNHGLEAAAPDPMTPMIDVIFSLIAFMMLMINAPLLSMEVKLPEVEKQQSSGFVQQQFVTITILNDSDSYKFDDGEPIGISQLRQQLQTAQAEGELMVMLETDQTTDVQRMMETLGLLNELKIDNVQVALNQAGGN
ncbi:ExbD/TolR family protein [Ferrimonas senticii]|uniref:ExbD/TolR family protein n=1 Tax=Ferrimonas senticii TaxID=394566 RepID=UPI000406CFE0|nr:biopolymer transporter ExbD [Ferrimonas senticii]